MCAWEEHLPFFTLPKLSLLDVSSFFTPRLPPPGSLPCFPIPAWLLAALCLLPCVTARITLCGLCCLRMGSRFYLFLCSQHRAWLRRVAWKNWFSVKMSDLRSLEFYVNRIPLSSPSVLRRTLANPPGNAQWWQSQLCGPWACWSPTPLPRDTVGDPAPSGGRAGLCRRWVWASAVDREEGSARPLLGLCYWGSLISAL